MISPNESDVGRRVSIEFISGGRMAGKITMIEDAGNRVFVALDDDDGAVTSCSRRDLEWEKSA